MKPRAKAFDEFAPVQFMELSDAERLDAPPFEPMPSGTSLDGRCELTLLLSPAVAGRLA